MTTDEYSAQPTWVHPFNPFYHSNVSCNLNYCITMGKKSQQHHHHVSGGTNKYGGGGGERHPVTSGSSHGGASHDHHQHHPQSGKAATCTYCLKERSRDVVDTKSRKHRKLSKTRLNSPIVVRLQDAIRKPQRSKNRSPVGHQSNSDSGSDEVVACKKHTVSLSSSGLSTNKKTAHHEKRRSSDPAKGENKILSAFLSAVEKAQSKDERAMSTCRENFTDYLNGSTDKVTSRNMLNNSVGYHKDTPTTDKSYKQDAPGRIDLICNDLSGKNSVFESDDGFDESESSSVISSTDDTVSLTDSDISSTTTSDSLSSDELTKEELERLVDYTTGVPLTKYDFPPHECQECLAAYYAYTQWCSYESPAGVYPMPLVGDYPGCLDYPPSSEEDERDKPKFDVLIKGPKKVEVSVAWLRNRKKKRHHGSKMVAGHHTTTTATSTDMVVPKDSVSVDLTHSDVQFEVQYVRDRTTKKKNPSGHQHSHNGDYHQYDHTNKHMLHQQQIYMQQQQHLQQQQQQQPHYMHHLHHYHQRPPPPGTTPPTPPPTPASPQQHQPFMYDDWSTYYPGYGFGMLPYTFPCYMLPPYYCLFPFYSIPRPLCVPRGLECLKSQRLCMVPASEIRNFTCGQPPQRPWLSLATPERQKPVVHYTTMCYNVLCDKYATRQLYGYCPSWALAWEYRKKGIIEEIRHYAADIITLQEVETDQYEKFFKVELEKDGYDGIFAPKSRARSMSEVDKKHVDGCAIFFRTRKFALVQEHLIEFNQLAMDKAEGSHEMLNRVMTKDNIALAALLETKREAWINGVPAESQIKQQILVTTCHVHWDPEFSDVKLVQTMMLMAEIKNILDKHSTNLRPGATSNDANSTPLLLCGDLNSLPDSGVLEYLTKGRVAGDHKDFKELGYQKCLQKMNMSEKKDFYTHAFKLDQAYHRQQLPYTNYTFDFKGIIDYIFHSADTIRPLGVLGALDQDWFLDNKVLGCPHPHIPSDHIPLLVEFEMSGKVDMVPSMAAGGGQQHQEQQQQPPPSNVAAGQSRR